MLHSSELYSSLKMLIPCLCFTLMSLRLADGGAVIFRDDPHHAPYSTQNHQIEHLTNQAASFIEISGEDRQSRASLQFPEKNTRLLQSQKAPILNSPSVNQIQTINHVDPNEPSETEEALVQAIENLVSRLQGIEQRVSGLENIVADLQHTPQSVISTVSVSPNSNSNSCPTHFASLPGAPRNSACYYFSNNSNKRQNWKDASSSCQELGGKLVEPQSTAELIQLISHIAALKSSVGSNYWTGGINPGLLWIWSVGTRQLQNIGSELWLSSSGASPGPEDNGKCLRLAYDQTTHRYGLQGIDCDRYLYFICQSEENGIFRRVPQSDAKNYPVQPHSVDSIVASDSVQSQYVASTTYKTQANHSDDSGQTTLATLNPTSEKQGQRNFVAVLGFRSVQDSTEMIADVFQTNVDQFGPFVPSETMQLESRTNVEQAP